MSEEYVMNADWGSEEIGVPKFGTLVPYGWQAEMNNSHTIEIMGLSGAVNASSMKYATFNGSSWGEFSVVLWFDGITAQIVGLKESA